ncbi:hypothetical protein [uncultured Tessaracoccus sp.]|uniref:hypothetical protein n=1 Tax=uncultured Tessaracoccus sp. TaxID=905023 RepID=UPI0025D75308|nr:hypothetical protein [uncultured Tessaracoccus sp.]
MPDFVREAEFVRGQAPKINGVEFPYLISTDGVHMDYESDRPPILWLPLIVDTTYTVRTQGISLGRPS